MVAQNAAYTARVQCSGSSNVSVNDSTIKSVMYISSCAKNQLSMQRNTFDVASGQIPGLGYALGLCSNTDPSNIAMTGSNKNTFVDTYPLGNTVRFCDAALASGSTWAIDGSSGAVFVATGRLYNSGTLNIGSGAVIKVSNVSYSDAGIHSKTGSELHVEGTSSDPVIFSSYKDDSIGGDTNTDGSSSSPSAGDYSAPLYLENDTEATLDYVQLKYGYRAAMVSGTSTALFNHTLVNYTNYGINVSGGNVNFRGSFENVSNRAITACDWDGSVDCSVDAAYVDWNRSDGPFNNSNRSNDLVCGMVTVSPWVYGSVEHDASMYSVLNCNGSTAPGSSMPANAAYFDQRIGENQIYCDGGYAFACTAITTAMNCLNAAIGLASSTSPFPLPGSSISTTGAAFSAGTVSAADTYVKGLEYETPATITLGALSGAANVIGIVSSLSSAYSSCAP